MGNSAFVIYGLILVAAATMAPSPTPSQWPCAKPTHEAQVLDAPQPKVSPTLVREALENGAQSTATVRVLLGPDGKVQEATIYHSSGSTVLDNAAIAAAQATPYAPKVIYCQPVAGVYLLTIHF